MGSDAYLLAQPRRERLGGQPEQVRPGHQRKAIADVRLARQAGTLQVEPPEAERRRRARAVDGRGGDEHGQRRSCPNGRQPGRGAPDRARPAGVARGTADDRSAAHRGRSADVSRTPTRAA